MDDAQIPTSRGLPSVSASVIIGLLLLAGCGRSGSLDSTGTMDEVAKQHIQLVELESRVSRLETADELNGKDHLELSNIIGDVNGDLRSLRATFNGNVKQDNERKAREATARGFCGQETYVDQTGLTRLHNKTCTVSDLPGPK